MVLINAYCTHRAPPPLDFPHELNNRRDRSDPELASHLDGFAGFVMQGGRRPLTQSLFHVLGHLERVQHHVSLEVEDGALDRFATWATTANAIVFLPDGSVRDPKGAVLVDPETGEPDPKAELPHPADARRRKDATDRRLAKLGVHVLESLPPVVGEVELHLREPAAVAARALALLAVAVHGESLATGDSISRDELAAKLPDGFRALTESERRFFAAKEPTRQEILNATWRYEALLVLAWALGLVPNLPFPSKICDVPALARALFASKDRLVSGARLIAAPTVLDELDLHYRLDWVVTQARANRAEPPAGIEPGVVAERHHALNWLVRFQDADWDHVATPT